MHPENKTEKTTSVESALNEWRNYIRNAEAINPNSPTCTVVHETWTPKVSWFRPPRWRIFRWAYNIKKTVFYGCYPSGIRTSVEETDDAVHIHHRVTEGIAPEVEIEFKVEPYSHRAIDELAAKLMNKPSENESDDNTHMF